MHSVILVICINKRFNNVPGTYDEFLAAQDSLNAYLEETLSESEASSFNNAIRNDIGVNFLGNLSNYMHNEAKRITTEEEGDTLLKCFVQTFCELSMFREMILHQKYAILEKAGHASAPAVKCVLNGEIRSHKKHDLDFLLNCLNVDYIVATPNFSKKTYPVITAYMNHVGVTPPFPNPLQQELRNQKWPDWFLSYDLKHCTYSIINKEGSQGTPFTFIQDETHDDLWILTSSWIMEKNRIWVNSSGKGNVNQDYYKGFFRIRRTVDGKCLLSPKPGAYLYMSHHSVDCRDGDPGPEGYWNITFK